MRTFPIQQEMQDRKRLPSLDIPWEVAEVAWKTYETLFGNSQTMERMAERGGFGREEFLALLAGRNPINYRPVLMENLIRWPRS